MSGTSGAQVTAVAGPPHDHLWQFSHRDDGKEAFWHCFICGADKPLREPSP